MPIRRPRGAAFPLSAADDHPPVTSDSPAAGDGVVRLAAGMVIAAVLVAALYFGAELLMPIAFAVLLGFLLDPAVTRLTRMGLPRIAAVLVVMALVLGALVALGAYLTSHVRSLGEELPGYQSTIRTKIRELRRTTSGPGMLDGAVETLDAVQEEMNRPAPGDTGDAAGGPPMRVEVVPPAAQPLAVAGAWIDRVSGPATSLGIVILFVALILLDRNDVRDRLLVLVGADLHRATDALDEASQRIGRYLRMQLIVNVTYGVPMALGLWWIGVPGAMLWGAFATIMRFVPYIGPLVAAAIPLVLAFAVDPGWSMLLWTAALIVTLELVSNNVIEPWLYGESTGLSAMAIILAATFWTTIWGPIGLVLSTPLTVCLFVLGRYLEPLRFLRVLLGSEPVMPMPERLYQRLIANDVIDARAMAVDAVLRVLPREAGPDDVAQAVIQFYDTVGVPALRLASERHRDIARTEHRLRIASGMDQVIAALAERFPVPVEPSARVRVICLGARWEVDALASAMLAHALTLSGHQAVAVSAAALDTTQPGIDDDTADADVICISTFSPQPAAQLRLLASRLHRLRPDAWILAAAWSAPDTALDGTVRSRTGVDAAARSVQELVRHVSILLHSARQDGYVPAPIPDDEEERAAALRASGVLEPVHAAACRDAVTLAANAFDVDYAQVAWVDRDRVHTPGTLVPSPPDEPADSLPRAHSIDAYVVSEGGAVVVEDTARDPRFTENPRLASNRIRFYAGVPLRDEDGRILGSFGILHREPRDIGPGEIDVLESMAADLMQRLRRDVHLEQAADA